MDVHCCGQIDDGNIEDLPEDIDFFRAKVIGQLLEKLGALLLHVLQARSQKIVLIDACDRAFELAHQILVRPLQPQMRPPPYTHPHKHPYTHTRTQIRDEEKLA